MPTDEMVALRAAIAQFEGALTRVETIATTNEKLVLAYRRQRVMIGILALFVALVIALGVVTIVNQINLAHNTEADTARAVIADFNACQGRNKNNRSTREGFAAMNDTFDSLVRTPEQQASVAELRKRINDALDPDEDCNKDGVVDVFDYPAGGGP